MARSIPQPDVDRQGLVTVNLRRVGIALATLAGLVVVALIAWFIIVFINTREPEEGRVCDCALLADWTANLPLSPQGDNFNEAAITVEEGTNGFFVTARRAALGDDIVESLRRVLSSSGIGVEVTDSSGVAAISVYPGSNRFEGPWSFSLTVAEDEIQLGIGVTVDGSLWGLERAEDLHRLYLDDPALALTAQEERQRQAIEILKPLKVAFEGMVEDG